MCDRISWNSVLIHIDCPVQNGNSKTATIHNEQTNLSSRTLEVKLATQLIEMFCIVNTCSNLLVHTPHLFQCIKSNETLTLISTNVYTTCIAHSISQRLPSGWIECHCEREAVKCTLIFRTPENLNKIRRFSIISPRCKSCRIALCVKLASVCMGVRA